MFDNAFDWLATKRSKFHLSPAERSYGDHQVKSHFLTRLQRLVADKLAPNFVRLLREENQLIF